MKNKASRYLALGGLVLLGLGTYYLVAVKSSPALVAEPKAAREKVAAPAAIEHPVPEAQTIAQKEESKDEAPEAAAPAELTTAPLPTNLDNSDPNTLEALAALIGKERVEALIFAEGFIRRFVVTVENASGPAIPAQSSIFKPTPGNLDVDHNEIGPVLSAKNYARYSDLVSAFVSVNSKALATFYSRYYPFFQSAYAELGMTGYFNDRLIAAIDKALAAPTPEGPVPLIEKGYYKFVDPELEKLSAVQKLMIRIGPEQAKLVKRKLKRIRALLVK